MKIAMIYCTISFNSSVTRHGPSKIDEMSQWSRSFGEVTKSFLDSKKKKLKKFGHRLILRKKSGCLTKFCTCHGHLSHLTKPYFRQARHTSQWLMNWLKWYSIIMKYPGKRMRCLIKPLGIIHNGLPGNCLNLIIKVVTTSLWWRESQEQYWRCTGIGKIYKGSNFLLRPF